MRFSRNIGLITERQQRQLEDSTILVCGLGGMGGVCAEVLARMGVGNLILSDHDVFEETNVNRQLHANSESIGRNKAETVGEELRRINPEANIVVETRGVHEDTVNELLEPADVLVNGMDKMRSSLILERTAREKAKPIVDAWITPFASVFVIQPDSPHWEEYLDLPTLGVANEELTEELCREALRKEIQYTFSHGAPYEYIERELVEEVINDQTSRPSLAPVVWLSGVLMANEVFKMVAGYRPTDHIGVIYDQYEHQLLRNGAPEQDSEPGQA